jgi:putative glutamine amidotransferase
MVIGITDTLNKKFNYYVSWIRRVAPDVEIVKLSPDAKNAKELRKCDGLILSGGSDIHPQFYGREDYLKLLKPDAINEKRDEFEIKIVKDALKQEMPILGVCRGMQLFNVVQSGSLIPDVITEGYKEHAKSKDGKDRRHKVEIEKGTTLHWIIESVKGEINSAHHQAVDRIGDGLRVTAKSLDGVVEALEWEDGKEKPFLQLVQWHPERMEDFGNPCSKNLLEHFVLAAVSNIKD